MNRITLASRKIFLLLAFGAAAWLAVGNAIHVLVASRLNQTIDITVCTSMGLKKVSQPGQTDGKATGVMKHCGNAAFAMLSLPPTQPTQLRFATPHTVAVWQFVDVLPPQNQHHWENTPPPGRAPPA